MCGSSILSFVMYQRIVIGRPLMVDRAAFRHSPLCEEHYIPQYIQSYLSLCGYAYTEHALAYDYRRQRACLKQRVL
jgi:hypothetical protein